MQTGTFYLRRRPDRHRYVLAEEPRCIAGVVNASEITLKKEELRNSFSAALQVFSVVIIIIIFLLFFFFFTCPGLVGGTIRSIARCTGTQTDTEKSAIIPEIGQINAFKYTASHGRAPIRPRSEEEITRVPA